MARKNATHYSQEYLMGSLFNSLVDRFSKPTGMLLSEAAQEGLTDKNARKALKEALKVIGSEYGVMLD